MDTDAAETVEIVPTISLVRAARLMTERALTTINVAEHGALGARLTYEDVTRGLRRARSGFSVGALAVSVAADPDPSPLADMGVPEPAPIGVESRAPALFEPDTLLPAQYADRLRRRRAEFDSERRLMIAVLELGIDDFVKHVGARDARRRALFHEAEAWIEDRDTSWPFAFESICDALDLGADYLRGGLRAWKERVTGRPPEAIRAADDSGTRQAG